MTLHDKIIAVFYPDCGPDGGKRRRFAGFMQRMADRLVQGNCRYGKATAGQLYLTRLDLEVKAYVKTGNREHLYNVANYCFLESICPQHPATCYDPEVGSVTRQNIRSKLE